MTNTEEPRPYIHRDMDYVNGVAQRKAHTVYRYAYTKTGKVSTDKRYRLNYATRYTSARAIKGVKPKHQLRSEAIEVLKQNAPKLPAGFKWGPIRDY